MQVREQGEFTAGQQRALPALLESPSIAAAAEVAGLNERTIRKYLDDERFAREYRRLRRAAFDEAFARLQTGALEAVNVLFGGLQHPEDSVRIKCASTILTHHTRIAHGLDQDERIAEIERILDESEGRGQRARR